jgi:hypothetical protein
LEILVRARIAGGHHIYGTNVVGKAFTPTRVDLALPAGIEPAGDWEAPPTSRAADGEFIYTDSVVFRRNVRARPDLAPGKVRLEGELHYQACTDELCWPPKTVHLSATLTVLP